MLAPSKVIFSLLALLSGVASSMNEGQQGSYQLAMETYPDLSDSSSKFRKQYEQVCRRMESANHQMLKLPDYPMMVVGRLATSLMARKTSEGQQLSRQDCEWRLQKLLERNQILERAKVAGVDELKSKLSQRMR